MRKALIALVLVFATAFGFGALTSTPAEAAPGPCFYKCVCPGVPVYCCGTSCKPVTGPSPIQCPQVAC